MPVVPFFTSSSVSWKSTIVVIATKTSRTAQRVLKSKQNFIKPKEKINPSLKFILPYNPAVINKNKILPTLMHIFTHMESYIEFTAPAIATFLQYRKKTGKTQGGWPHHVQVQSSKVI